MAQSTSRTTFLSLPVELRLQIAAYVLEQPANIGLYSRPFVMPQLEIDYTTYLAYSGASNLAILLVCRQFHQDFAKLAFQMTTFVLSSTKEKLLHTLPVTKIGNIRKLRTRPSNSASVQQWQSYPFDDEHLHLDELSLVMKEPDHDLTARFLRRLRHVKKVRIFPIVPNRFGISRWYGQLVGRMYKVDHYLRYDAPDAPNVGNTWYEPDFNVEDKSYDFSAQDPKPAMPEEDYMIMMKPKIDNLMQWMASI